MNQAIVVSQGLLGLWRIVGHLDEGVIGIEIPVELADSTAGVRVLGHVGVKRGVAGTENAAGHRDEVGQESQFDRIIGHGVELLADFWQVAVAVDRVGHDILVHLGEVSGHAEGAASAGNSGLAVNDDVTADEIVPNCRSEGQDGAAGVAAGIGHQAGIGDGVSVELGEAVNSLFEVGGIRVIDAVPLAVDVGLLEAEVGGDVDNLDALLKQRDAGFGAGLVGQG